MESNFKNIYEGAEQSNGGKIAPKILVKCEICEFSLRIKSHLQSKWTWTWTKHEVRNFDKK